MSDGDGNPPETNSVELSSILSDFYPFISCERDDEDDFKNKSYIRWKDALDALKIFIHISLEFGLEYNNRNRPLAAQVFDYKFEALINLHARSIRVSQEIYTLLYEGFPDGALSRWRTLHELSATAKLLSDSDSVISERFIYHREITALKNAKKYREFEAVLGFRPMPDEELARLEHRRDFIVDKFGKEMDRDLGWAHPVIQQKRITIADIERAAGLAHWRPIYSWACDDIHASFTPSRVGLGVSEAKQDLMLVGRSDSGYTDPAQFLAMSLNSVDLSLPFHGLIETDYAILTLLEHLVEHIKEAFWKRQKSRGADESG